MSQPTTPFSPDGLRSEFRALIYALAGYFGISGAVAGNLAELGAAALVYAGVRAWRWIEARRAAAG